MKKVIYLILLFALAISVKSQSLPNIELLKTTRAEIEKMFGDKYQFIEKTFGDKDQFKYGFCTYSTDEGIYYFYYSTAPCKSGENRWNVPNNTLLGYNFEPKKIENFQYLNNKELIVAGQGHQYWNSYYIDENKGIVYSVNSKGQLTGIHYEPSSDKKALLKKEFQPYNIAGQYYYSSRFFFSDEKRILERTLITDPPVYQRFDNLKFYFVGYTFNNYSPVEFKKYLKKLENLAFVKKKFSKKMVEIIYGGQLIDEISRHDFVFQLFIIPNNYPPPVPDPKKLVQN